MAMESLPEKFFQERDLEVVDPSLIDTDRQSAQGWFDAVESVVADLPVYSHDNIGMPLARGRTSPTESGDDGVWFFRGQKDVSFAFHSTLYRRLLDASRKGLSPKGPRGHEAAMVKAEVSLLEKAEENGIGRGLSGLETLTLLQHHGSPTRLIDVTSDWKVALYFACESADSRDGRVFLLKVPHERWEYFPRAKSAQYKDEHKYLVWEDYAVNFPKGSGMALGYDWLSGVWPVLLPFTDPRMISQRGFFSCGGRSFVKGQRCTLH